VIYLIRFLGAIGLFSGLAMCIRDLYVIGQGWAADGMFTGLGAMIKIAQFGGHGEWFGFAVWISLPIIGAFALFLPFDRRLPRPPATTRL
jgi:hypothetical protein